MNETRLDLPPRTRKPRSKGRTHILDKSSVGHAYLEDQLSLLHEYIDLVKLGWGTSVVTPKLQEKIELYRKYNIEVCLGGTLFELFYVQRKVDEYAAWLKELGIGVVEISDGTINIETSVKLQLIERFSRDFKVYSEVGSKDASVILSPVKWIKAINAELSAGATYIILEGRESGTAGLYRPTGEVRMGLVDEILGSGISPERLVFEAPQKPQQVWLIEQAGTDVNLGNIPAYDVIGLETLRLGLRADTLLHFFGDRLAPLPE